MKGLMVEQDPTKELAEPDGGGSPEIALYSSPDLKTRTVRGFPH